MLEDIFNFYIKQHQLPMAMLATVLLQIYKNRETSWKSCTEGRKVETLTQL